MPEWLTALLAALLGGFLSLAGVWMQLQHQQRRHVPLRAPRMQRCLRACLRSLSKTTPIRAERMMQAQEPLPRGWDAETDSRAGPRRSCYVRRRESSVGA